MAIRVIVHLANEDPFSADIESMPNEAATSIFIKNPRTREGRAVPWVTGPNKGFIFPMARVTFLEFPITGGDMDDVEYPFRNQTKS